MPDRVNNTHDKVQLYNQNIPRSLKREDKWFLYDFNSENPKQPFASDGTPATWSDEDAGEEFQKVLDSLEKVERFDAIGFKFSESDPYLFIDWDGTFDEPRDKDSQKNWMPPVDTIGTISYTEWSSSGTGAHTIFEGDIPDWWEQADGAGEHEGVEMFDSRMCIFTGEVIDRRTIQSTDEVEKLAGDEFDDMMLEVYEKVEDQAPRAFQTSTAEQADNEVVEKYDGEVFEALDEVSPHAIEDILWSEYQGDRKGGAFEEWNPSYRESESGTALTYNSTTGTWFDFNYGKEAEDLFSTLELFAAERGRIEKPVNGLEGEEWVNAYKNFRNKCEEVGVELPDLDEQNGGIEVLDDPEWEEIRASYVDASNDTERGKCALSTARKLMTDDSWMKVRGRDDLYLYEEGVFSKDRETDMLQQKLNDGLLWEYKSSRMNRIKEMLESRVMVPEEKVGCNQGTVVTENGTLDVVEEELHDWSPEYNARRKLPVQYDEEADDPETFLSFLDEVLTGEDEIAKVQEFFGYSLMHWSVQFHKSLFLVGPTNSGKSTLLDVLQMLHDNEAVSHVTPQELSKERFASQQLDGSWLNVRNDIPSETVNDVGKFKELIAGDEIKVERKGQDPYSIEPQAKHAYAGNQLPSASVDDDAFYERVLLLSLPYTIPREDQDRQLLNKIERELPAVLNWAVEGLQRLMEQEEFTGDMSASETEEMWQKWSSSVKRFAHECIRVTKNENDELSKEAVMEIFEAYTDYRGMPSASKKTVTQTITSKTGVSHSTYGGTDGSGVYTGLELNELGEEFFQYLNDDERDNEKLKELMS